MENNKGEEWLDDFEVAAEWKDGGSDEYEDIPEKTKGMKRILHSFVNPRALAANIKHHQNMGSAILLIIILSFLSIPMASSLAEISAETLNEAILEKYGTDFYLIYSQQQAMVMDLTGNENMALITAIITSVTSIISILLMSFVSALFYFLLCKIFKIQATYMQIYIMILHLSAITLVGTLLASVGMVLLKTNVNVFSLANFTGGDYFDPMYHILSGINVFSIWYLIYMAIGLSELGKSSIIKAFIVAIIIFAVSVSLSSLSPKVLTWALDQQAKTLEMGR